MRNENVRKFTVSSLYLAIEVVLIIGASVIPGFDLTLLAVASAVGAFTIVESGIRYGVVQYAAADILGFLLAPDKAAAVLFVIFFGLYPIVKYFAEKPKKPWVQLMIKCGFCLVVSIAALAGFSELVKICTSILGSFRSDQVRVSLIFPKTQIGSGIFFK